MKKIIYFIGLVAISLQTISCDDFLDIEPEGKVIPKTVEDYRKVITSAYSKYPTHKSLTSLRTDELGVSPESNDYVSYRELFMWKDSGLDPVSNEYPWLSFYNVIFYTNQIINEGVKTMANSPQKDQILAEAHALRAYAYFDLVNLFGKPYNKATSSVDKGVPLNLSVDLEQVLAASTVEEIYQQVHKDLAVSKKLMTVEKQIEGINYRFSKVALAAFEARVFLYQNNWTEALKSANTALSIKNQLVNLNASKILPNHYTSVESIMALEMTFDSPIKNMGFISDELFQAYHPTGDLRFPLYFEKKGNEYKVIKGGASEFKVSFRVAELYFIKAESLLKTEQLEQAKETLKQVLINRYTAETYTPLAASLDAMNKDQLMSFILDERFREFALEGQRWFDLRRAHQKRIIHVLDGKEYTLIENDPRYTISIPDNAKQNNPYL